MQRLAVRYYNAVRDLKTGWSRTMNRKFAYSDAEWEAYARGESLAEAKRPLKLPIGLNAFEQTACREGYLTRCEDIKNRPIVAEIKKMVRPLPIQSLFIRLVHND